MGVAITPFERSASPSGRAGWSVAATFAAVATGLLLSLVFGCDGDRGAAGAPALAVAEEFRLVCQTLRMGDEPYFGEGPARRLAALTQPPEGTQRALSDPVAHAALLVELGMELLELGRPEDAVRLLEQFEVKEPGHVASEIATEAGGVAVSRDKAPLAVRADSAALVGPEGRGDSTDPSLRK